MSLIDTFVEVQLSEAEDFLKIKETLTRIGVASRKENKLYQSCHILHKQNKYYIVHFKELFLLDGKVSNFSEDDKGRRNTIITLLKEWDLIKIMKPDMVESPKSPMGQIKIISYSDKKNWTLEAKYNIGRKKKTDV
jgi:hypothetical protein